MREMLKWNEFKYFTVVETKIYADNFNTYKYMPVAIINTTKRFTKREMLHTRTNARNAQ